MANNLTINVASGTAVTSTEEVSTLNGGSVTAQHVQRMLLAIRTGSGTAIDLPGDATNGIDVDVTRLPGNAAHGSADAGNPVKTGGRARTALPSAASQDQRVDAIHDKFGRRLSLVAPLDQRTSGTATFTGNTAGNVIGAPGASTAIVVTAIVVVNAHATVGTKVTVRDDMTGKVVGYAAPAGGGFVVADPNGLFVAATNRPVTAICGTTGADVDVTVFGYLIPA
jgi:hypothetical protein